MINLQKIIIIIMLYYFFHNNYKKKTKSEIFDDKNNEKPFLYSLGIIEKNIEDMKYVFNNIY